MSSTIQSPARSMKWRSTVSALAMTTASGLLASCLADPSLDEEVSAGHAPLYLEGSARNWNENDKVMPICWNTPGYATEKGWVQAAVNNTWGRNSSLRFVWRASCPTTGTER